MGSEEEWSSERSPPQRVCGEKMEHGPLQIYMERKLATKRLRGEIENKPLQTIWGKGARHKEVVIHLKNLSISAFK